MEDFGMKDAAAATSSFFLLPSNIERSDERNGNKEFINFLYIAKGSCGEVRSQIVRASDVGFIDNETATRLYNDCLNLSKIIAKFITSLKKSPITGLKNLNPES